MEIRFKELSIKKRYRSGDDSLADDFFKPMLSVAKKYDRATGYFSVSSVELLGISLREFSRRGGYMRLIASPNLTAADLELIELGYKERAEVVFGALTRTIEEIESRYSSLSLGEQSFLFMMSENRLELKIVIPREPRVGMYHEKIGLFDDGSDKVAFIGSANETASGLHHNFESIDVYTSWDESERVDTKVQDFSDLWQGQTYGLETLEFPDALSKRLINLVAPESKVVATSDLNVPKFVLRDYQRDALQAWQKNGHCGILQMATGTGKTLTAISAIDDAISKGVKVVIVLAPFIHLAEQWRTELDEKLGCNLLVCHSQTKWKLTLPIALLQAEHENRSFVCILTYDTARTPDFRKQLASYLGEKLLVADEVHNVTAELATEVFEPFYKYRLALSATPERYLDEDGTAVIMDFFDGVVYSITLGQAIEGGFLTKYLYYPRVVYMDDEIGNDGILSARDRARLDYFSALTTLDADFFLGATLVYVNPPLLKPVLEFLGIQKHFKVHSFTSKESKDQRLQLLERFADHELQGLVAMRCLDEGVDIPTTRSAYLLASSDNPRQFVQRRGRVLRLSPGKTHAVLHDLVTLGKADTPQQQAWIARELTRVGEFAMLATNSNEAVAELAKAAPWVDFSNLEQL